MADVLGFFGLALLSLVQVVEVWLLADLQAPLLLLLGDADTLGDHGLLIDLRAPRLALLRQAEV